jgi:hypothetical protein
MVLKNSNFYKKKKKLPKQRILSSAKYMFASLKSLSSRSGFKTYFKYFFCNKFCLNLEPFAKASYR